MSHFWRPLFSLAVFLTLATGCGDGEVSCGTGQEKQFDSKTGAAKCVDSADGASVDNDANGKLSDGASTTADGAAVTDSKVIAKDTGEEPDPDAVSNPPDWLVAPTCPSGATGLERWWNCPPTKQASGALHGKACTKDQECLYGHCMFGHPMAAYDPAIGFCAKNCKYTGGGKATNCAEENVTPEPKFECVFEKTQNSGNDKRAKSQVANGLVFAACMKFCKSDAECIQWNPDLPNCTNQSTKYISLGANKVCVRN